MPAPRPRQQGFTLIELLVVTTVIGMLAMVAMPQYVSFRARGIDAKIASLVRHVATAEEEYFITNRTYSDDVTRLEGLVLDGVQVTVSAGNSGDLGTSFRIRGTHPRSSRDFEWVSDPTPGALNFFELTPSG